MWPLEAIISAYRYHFKNQDFWFQFIFCLTMLFFNFNESVQNKIKKIKKMGEKKDWIRGKEIGRI